MIKETILVEKVINKFYSTQGEIVKENQEPFKENTSTKSKEVEK